MGQDVTFRLHVISLSLSVLLCIHLTEFPSSASFVPAVSVQIVGCSIISFVWFPLSLSSSLLLPQRSLLFSPLMILQSPQLCRRIYVSFADDNSILCLSAPHQACRVEADWGAAAAFADRHATITQLPITVCVWHWQEQSQYSVNVVRRRYYCSVSNQFVLL